MMQKIIKVLGDVREKRFFLYLAIFLIYIGILILTFIGIYPALLKLSALDKIYASTRIISSFSLLFGAIILLENLIRNKSEGVPLFSLTYKKGGSGSISKLDFVIENYGSKYITLESATFSFNTNKKNIKICKEIEERFPKKDIVEYLKELYGSIIIGPKEKLEFKVSQYLKLKDVTLKTSEVRMIEKITVKCAGPSKSTREIKNILDGTILIGIENK